MSWHNVHITKSTSPKKTPQISDCGSSWSNSVEWILLSNPIYIALKERAPFWGIRVCKQTVGPAITWPYLFCPMNSTDASNAIATSTVQRFVSITFKFVKIILPRTFLSAYELFTGTVGQIPIIYRYSWTDSNIMCLTHLLWCL